MTTFVITAPDGKKYKVTGDTPEGAHAALMKMLGDQAPVAATPTEAPQYAPNGVPMNAAAKAEIAAKAKAGTLAVSPQSAAGSEAMTAKAEAAVARPWYDPILRTAGDLTLAGVTGLGQGAMETAGLPGTAAGISEAGARKIAGLLGMDASGIPEGGIAALLPGGGMPSGAGIRGEMSDLTGGFTEYEPETTAGDYAQTVGQFIGGGLKPSLGLIAGVASEGAGKATEGTAFEPYARFAAGLLGPSALSIAGSAAKRVISPMGGADPARLAMADDLVAAGVPVTAGQKTGSDWLRRLEAQTSKGAAMADDQIEALTSAALKTAGVNAPRATADVLDDAFARIGKDFDDAVSGVAVAPDPALINRMASAADEFKLLAPKDASGIFGAIQKEMVKAFRSGNAIDGSVITKWRSSIGKLLKSGDVATREAAKATVAILDDALTGALGAAGRADDVVKLATARKEYRNLLAITDAVGGSSEKAAMGLLTAEMLPAAVKKQGRKAFVTGGRGDIGDLARSAQGIMRRPSSSGTVENLAAMMRPAAVPIGLGVGGIAGGPLGALGGAALAMSPAIMRRLAVSEAGQAYLGNQLLGAGAPIFTKANAFGVARRVPGLLAQ